MDIPILKVFLSLAKVLESTRRNQYEKESSNGSITISKGLRTGSSIMLIYKGIYFHSGM